MATVAVIRSRLWMELGDREPLRMVYSVLWVKTSFVSRLWRRLAHVILIPSCIALEAPARLESGPRGSPGICQFVFLLVLLPRDWLGARGPQQPYALGGLI